MKLLCLCPTFGRTRSLLENSLACFVTQEYPVEDRRLLFYDDGGNISAMSDETEGWRLMRDDRRQPTLPMKYNAMLVTEAAFFDYDAVVVWDDDDIYLPHHLSAIAGVLKTNSWSHPLQVLSTYGTEPGEVPRLESAAGRFHGSLAIRRDLLTNIGGWIQTPRADFDQQQIAACQDIAGDPGRPDRDQPPSYIFRWQDSGDSHCQGIMRGPENTDWYERNAIGKEDRLPITDILQPHLDLPAAGVVLAMKRNEKRPG